MIRLVPRDCDKVFGHKLATTLKIMWILKVEFAWRPQSKYTVHSMHGVF
jgi:hypothetical protein